MGKGKVMATDLAMLAAVRRNPADKTIALAAADALQENGLERFAALRTVCANRKAGRIKKRQAAVAGKLKAAGPQVRFFYKHAGGVRERGETWEEGRLRYARRLAMAEEWLRVRVRDDGWEVVWEEDWDYDPSHYDAPGMPDFAWGCIINRDDGEPASSLWAITFGGDGYPNGQPYARVVEAELALEIMGYWPEDGTDDE